jgi:hypothetical protein
VNHRGVNFEAVSSPVPFTGGETAFCFGRHAPAPFFPRAQEQHRYHTRRQGEGFWLSPASAASSKVNWCITVRPVVGLAVPALKMAIHLDDDSRAGRDLVRGPAGSSRGGAVVAQRIHNPLVAGSIPAPANFMGRDQ